MLRDFFSHVYPGMLGLAAVRIRGALCKSFCVDFCSEHTLWVLVVQGVLCVGFNLWRSYCLFFRSIAPSTVCLINSLFYWQLTFQRWHGVSQPWAPSKETDTWDTETLAGSVLFLTAALVIVPLHQGGAGGGHLGTHLCHCGSGSVLLCHVHATLSLH